MEKSNTIGSRIEELRKKKGMTQSELAKEIGVKRETVVQWENNTRDLKTQATIRLADFFDVTCDEILRGIPSRYTDIHKQTNLSAKAISILGNFGEQTETKSGNIRVVVSKSVPAPDVISEIIEHDEFLALINYILSMKSRKSASEQSIVLRAILGNQRLWEFYRQGALKTFDSIITTIAKEPEEPGETPISRDFAYRIPNYATYTDYLIDYLKKALTKEGFSRF